MDAEPDQPYWKLCEEKAPAAAQAIFDSWDGSLTFVGHLNWVSVDYLPPAPRGFEIDEARRVWHQKLNTAMLNLLAEKVKTDGR